jgi:hypothetical protein
VTLTATQSGKKLSVKRYKRFESAQLQGHVKKIQLEGADRLPESARHAERAVFSCPSCCPALVRGAAKEKRRMRDPDRKDLFQNRSADQTAGAPSDSRERGGFHPPASTDAGRIQQFLFWRYPYYHPNILRPESVTPTAT